jgi:hypothetical protein
MAFLGVVFSSNDTAVTLLCMEWFSKTSTGAFLAHNSTVTGDVRLGAESSVWFGAVVRGDVAPITIGDRVNIQDGAVVHCDTGHANSIEDDVTIGHRAVVHGERVGRGTLERVALTCGGRYHVFLARFDELTASHFMKLL